MADDITDFYVHTVTVQTLTGYGATGDVYAAGQSVSCYVDDTISLVRNSEGETVTAMAHIYCSTADGAKFTADSLVTFPSGRTSRVIAVNQLDVAGLLAGVEHTAVHTT